MNINENAGAGGAEQFALDMVWTDDSGAQVRDRIYPVDRGWPKQNYVGTGNYEEVDGKQVEIKRDETEEEAKLRQQNELSAKLTHIIGAYGGLETFQNLIKNGVADFRTYIEHFIASFPKDFATTPVRVKIQYKYGKSYLRIPAHMKHGYFVELMTQDPSRLEITSWEQDNVMSPPNVPGVVGADDGDDEAW